MCELTILMPCLNEAETLASCIQKAKEFLTHENVQGEILIADNGSTDGSQAIAIAAGARVIAVETRGYGAALKQGISAANGKYIIMGDADDSYDFLNLQLFLQKLRAGYDLVMGNRFKGGIAAGAMPFLNRYIGNPILSLIGRIFFKNTIGDFHCGLRGMRKERVLALDCRGDGMEFASEMIVRATLNRLKITEVPTRLFPDGRSRRPHLRPWRDGWRHLRLLLLFSPRWLFLYPGLVLMLGGFILLSLLLAGPIRIGGAQFDIHTMLFGGLFMIMGAQVVCFAIFATYIAERYGALSQNHLQHFLRYFTLERGLIVGIICIIGGVIGASYTFSDWWEVAFGPLSPTHSMRILIPAITFFILGMQLIFASFFMSLLTLHDNRTYFNRISIKR